MTLAGIDASAAGQGTAFSWAPYKGKVQFGFTKVSEGLGYADPSAARNIAQMKADKIVPGGYHFLHAGVSGSAQAEAFLSHAKAAGLGAGCLLALDAEDLGLDGEDAAQMNLTASAFRAELQRHFPGFNPVAYTEISMAPALTSLGSCPLWLANPSGMAVKSIGPWKGGPSFEQVAQRGVDADVFYGTAAQLAALALPH
jgi:GH25 family lysozyme M1 (1,4-beta-N-acetylmuramidase)